MIKKRNIFSRKKSEKNYLEWNPEEKKKKKGLKYHSILCSISLRTSVISSRTSIVEVISPNTVSSSFNVIAVGMISQKVKVWQRNEVVIPINNLQVSEVRCFSEALVGEATASHLRWCVRTEGSRVHYLSSKLDHAGMGSQMAEQERWPVPDEKPRPELEPPMPMLWILDAQTQ